MSGLVEEAGTRSHRFDVSSQWSHRVLTSSHVSVIFLKEPLRVPQLPALRPAIVAGLRVGVGKAGALD